MKSRRKLLMFIAPLMLATLACTCGLTQQLGNLAEQQVEQLSDDAMATAGAMAGESIATVQAEAEAEGAADGAGGDSGGDVGDITFGGSAEDSPFPVPDGQTANVILQTEDMINYQIDMSIEDLMAYYRGELGATGYTEREGLTVVDQGVASMVFDGDPSGMALVVQMVDLGEGGTNVNVRLEDV